MPISEDAYQRILLQLETTEGLSKSGLLQAMLGDTVAPSKAPEGIWGNIYIRPMEFAKKGSSTGGHVHRFDHITMLSAGSVMCKWQNTQTGAKGEETRKAPFFFLVKGLVTHEFTALEDGTMAFCIYSHRDPNTEEVVDNFNGFMGAYG